MFQKLYLCNYSWVYFQCTLAILPFPSNVKLSTAWKVSLLQNRHLFQAICPSCLWARDNWWLLSWVQRLAGPAGGDRGLLSRLEAPTGTKGPPFVSNRDKRHWPPYPLPSPPARAIQLTCFLLFLAREREVIAHFFTTFVKIFDSPSIHRR